MRRDRDEDSDSECYEFAILHEDGVRTERGYSLTSYAEPLSPRVIARKLEQRMSSGSRAPSRGPSRTSLDRVDLYG